jgi:S-adenosylmethionine hydrolase
MKGVILSLVPPARLVDITHHVERHQVAEGVFALEAAAPRFPPGTIHLAVVDPGVGTARRAIAVASGGHLFVGPDNGLLTAAFRTPGWRAWELTAPEYRLPVVSRTFHGRDIFAPAAAHLALGVDPARLGPPVVDPVRLEWPEPRAVGTALAGTVIHVDRFGNVITSLEAEGLAGLPGRGAAVVRIGGRSLPVVGTYADLEAGSLGALVGSRGRLEVVVRDGSAAARLGIARGAPVRVSRRSSLPPRMSGRT